MTVWEKQYDFYKSLPNYYNTLLDTVAIYDCLNEALYRISYYYLYHFPDDSKRAFIDELRNTLYDDYQRFIIVFHSDEEDNSKPIEFRDKEAECKLFNSLADSAKEIKSYINKEIEIAPEPYRAWFKALKSICNHIVRLKNNIHHCICKEMFASVFHGETVYVYIDNYDVIPSDKEHYMSAFMNATPEAGEPVEYLHCSVVSKKMLDYDRTMFNLLLENDNDKEKINYRPYFMEFIIPIDKDGKAKGHHINIAELSELTSENGWFEAKFISNGNNMGSDNYSYVEGGMLTFASPADYISGKLVFQKPEFKRTSKELKTDIEGVYNRIHERKTDEINVLLEDHIRNIKWADIYNIGHGNFITLNDNKDNTKVVYDIGLPYSFPVSKSFSKVKQDFKPAYDIMKKIKAEIVIISHWDSDHYIGAYCNEQDIFDIPWIVTECNPKGQINAKRIMAYLYCKKNSNYQNNLFFTKEIRPKHTLLLLSMMTIIHIDFSFTKDTGHHHRLPLSIVTELLSE